MAKDINFRFHLSLTTPSYHQSNITIQYSLTLTTCVGLSHAFTLFICIKAARMWIGFTHTFSSMIFFSQNPMSNNKPNGLQLNTFYIERGEYNTWKLMWCCSNTAMLFHRCEKDVLAHYCTGVPCLWILHWSFHRWELGSGSTVSIKKRSVYESIKMCARPR